MSKPRLMAVVGAMLAALLISAVALAQTPPHTFFGLSGDTTVDGEAADGAAVVASVGGEAVGSATLDASGEWSIEVEGGSMGVSFSVNGMAADGSHDAAAGGSTRVTLAVATPVEEPAGDLEGDDAVEPGDDAMEPGDDAMEPGDDAMEPGDDAMEPGDDAMEPGDDAMEPGDDAMEPGDDAMEPGDDAMEPGDDAMEPGDDAMEPGDDAMEPGDDAMEPVDDAMEPEEGETMEPEDDEVMEPEDDETMMPSTGTGGLADSSGSNSWAFGLAGALALTALLGGVAIRRRVQS